MRRPAFSPRAESWLRAPAPATPAALKPWLGDPGSLTARIRARCRHFEVRVLSQHRAALQADEAALLAGAGHAQALVREVLLCADGVAVVFAHSVLLPRHLRGAWHLVAGLGARPLGALLFADPAVRRGALHSAKLGLRDRRYRRLRQAMPAVAWPPALWARRSVFVRHGRPLLVTEIFLPAILDLAP